MIHLWNRIKPYLSIPSKPLIGFAFASTAILSSILFLGWFALPESILTFSKTSILGFSIISILRSFGVLFVPFVFLMSRYLIPEKLVYGTNPGLGAYILCFLCGFPAILIYSSIHNITLYTLLVNDIYPPLPAIFTSTTLYSYESTILIILVAAILPILIQELFFRGLLYALFPQQHRGWLGIVSTSFLFAIYMLNPVDFLGLFLLGLLLGWIRRMTNNVFCPMLTQVAMVLCFFIFRKLLPFLDVSKVRSYADIDISVIYISVVVLIISFFSILLLLSNLYRVYLGRQIDAIYDTDSENSAIKPHLGGTMLLSVVLYSGIWALLFMYR